MQSIYKCKYAELSIGHKYSIDTTSKTCHNAVYLHCIQFYLIGGTLYHFTQEKPTERKKIATLLAKNT